MKRIYKIPSIVALLFMCASVFVSCKSDDPLKEKGEKLKTTVLLYAVASNNLSSFLTKDMNEIIECAPELDLERYSMLVYRVLPEGNPQLLELKENGSGAYVFEPIKTYNRELYSTDPERLSEVIYDVENLRPSEKRGIILWSHGWGWYPAQSQHPKIQRSQGDKVEILPDGWFGEDSYDGVSDHMDIIELADAIPDGHYDFIWFDCCYMSSIETIYEIRDKCKYIVAYPMEVYGEGMPYHLTLPYILQETPNLTAAADQFASYFLDRNRELPAAVMVGDMTKVEAIAKASKACYEAGLEASVGNLMTYSRRPIPMKYYDLKEYWLSAYGEDSNVMQNLQSAINGFVMYSRMSSKTFAGLRINKNRTCAISVVDCKPEDEEFSYYKQTAWYTVTQGE